MREALWKYDEEIIETVGTYSFFNVIINYYLDTTICGKKYDEPYGELSLTN